MAFLEHIKKHYGHLTLFTVVTFPFDEHPEQFDRWIKDNATEQVVKELTILQNTLKVHVEELANPQRSPIATSHRFTLVKFINLEEQEQLGRFYEVMVKLSKVDHLPTYANCILTFDEHEIMSGVLHSHRVLAPWV